MTLKEPGITRPLRIVVGIAATCLGVALTWYMLARSVPPGRSLLLSVGFLVLLWILFRIGVLQAPSGYNTLTFGQSPRMRDVLRSIGCIAGGFAWLVLLTRRVSNTEAGAALLVVPFILLVVVGTFFLLRGIFFTGPKN